MTDSCPAEPHASPLPPPMVASGRPELPATGTPAATSTIVSGPHQAIVSAAPPDHVSTVASDTSELPAVVDLPLAVPMDAEATHLLVIGPQARPEMPQPPAPSSSGGTPSEIHSSVPVSQERTGGWLKRLRRSPSETPSRPDLLRRQPYLLLAGCASNCRTPQTRRRRLPRRPRRFRSVQAWAYLTMRALSSPRSSAARCGKLSQGRHATLVRDRQFLQWYGHPWLSVV